MGNDGRQPASDKLTPTRDELASGQRMIRHLTIGLMALSIPLLLSGLILLCGQFLMTWINIKPNSLLFQLWPFNKIYLQQFGSSAYDVVEIKWFFTVISCANAVWMAFLCWKVLFEVFRRDVAFPSGNSPLITQAIMRRIIVACVMLALCTFVAQTGFSKRSFSALSPLLEESITAGAVKIVTVEMFFFYFGIGYFIEYGGLAIRYGLSKLFGYFVLEVGSRRDGI